MSQTKIKLEESCDKPNIKEKLNLHVKRRLQQDSPINTESPINDVVKKETPKTRKPYQKRAATSNKGKKSQISSPAPEHPTAEPSEEGGLDLDASLEATETKCSSSRERKSSDILSMVLSVKKRALMQDPEVQEFWSKVMTAIKS